jgi:hypothetical protein
MYLCIYIYIYMSTYTRAQAMGVISHLRDELPSLLADLYSVFTRPEDDLSRYVYDRYSKVTVLVSR